MVKTENINRKKIVLQKSLTSLLKSWHGSIHPKVHHENEDCLAEYVIDNLNWKIKKVNGRWVGEDYAVILEQGGFNDIDQKNLILAAAGRIKRRNK